MSALFMIAASCSKDDPVPTPEPPAPGKTVEIKINALADFQSGLTATYEDDTKYSAIVQSDLSVDSVGLARTLVDWKKLDDAKANLATDWKGKGIYVPKKKIIYPFDIYVQAGKPKVVANPGNGAMPYAANGADSTEYSKQGLKLKVFRVSGDNEAQDVNELVDLVDAAANSNEPVIINITDVLETGNGDAKELEKALEEIVNNSNITVNGKIEVAPTSDSVAVTNNFINNLNTANGRIISNGTNALFIKNIGDMEKLREVLGDNAFVRTDESDNFKNVDVAVPNKIIWNEDAPANSGAGVKAGNDRESFAQGVHRLPKRTGWKNGRYLGKTVTGISFYVNEEDVFARISQPSVRGTRDYPNPDIWFDTDPVYTQMNLDRSGVYSDSLGYAIHQRVKGSRGQTKMYTDHRSSDDRWMLEYYYTAENIVQMTPLGGSAMDVVLIHIDDKNFPREYPISDKRDGSWMHAYGIDARKYCFVVSASASAGLAPQDSPYPSDGWRNNHKVMDLVNGEIGTGRVSIDNQFLDSSNFGSLKNMHSFFWITWDEYLEFVAAGKRAR